MITFGQKLDSEAVLAVPIVPECVSRRLLPAFVCLWIQQAVVSMDGMTEVISSILLTCQKREKLAICLSSPTAGALVNLRRQKAKENERTVDE